MSLTLRDRTNGHDDRAAGFAATWVDREIAGCEFRDARLGKRFRTLLERIGSDIGQSIPFVCQDWANTKAAYRFLANHRVSEADILSGHFQSTRERVAAANDLVLVLHDTTEFTYQRDRPELIGITKCITNSKRDLAGNPRMYTACGILMHSSLAITTAGLPLGLCAVKFWTRDKFKGTAALKRKINPTRVPIEKKESIRWLENLKQSTELLDDPGRCIHIGDRESDIYELFCTAQEVGTHFLVRTCVDRLAGDGDHTVADEMDVTSVKGLHRIEVRDDKGDLEEAILEIRYRRIRTLRPLASRSDTQLTLTVIHAQEQKTPKNRKKIDWKLLTDLPVQSRKDAIEKLEWYAMRWKIEMFHKILKSGCKAEESRLRTAALTETEIELLDHLVKDEAQAASRRKTLSQYLIKIAKLGGYLARANDPPPGNIVMWRDIGLGAAIGARIVGN